MQIKRKVKILRRKRMEIFRMVRLKKRMDLEEIWVKKLPTSNSRSSIMRRKFLILAHHCATRNFWEKLRKRNRQPWSNWTFKWQRRWSSKKIRLVLARYPLQELLSENRSKPNSPIKKQPLINRYNKWENLLKEVQFALNSKDSRESRWLQPKRTKLVCKKFWTLKIVDKIGESSNRFRT